MIHYDGNFNTNISVAPFCAESDRAGDFADAEIGIEEKVAGLGDANAVDVFGEVHVGGFLEHLAERIGTPNVVCCGVGWAQVGVLICRWLGE